jgi:hypothetical protein
MERAEHNGMKAAMNMLSEGYSIPDRGCEDVFIFWPHLKSPHPRKVSHSLFWLYQFILAQYAKVFLKNYGRSRSKAPTKLTWQDICGCQSTHSVAYAVT